MGIPKIAFVCHDTWTAGVGEGFFFRSGLVNGGMMRWFIGEVEVDQGNVVKMRKSKIGEGPEKTERMLGICSERRKFFERNETIEQSWGLVVHTLPMAMKRCDGGPDGRVIDRRHL